MGLGHDGTLFLIAADDLAPVRGAGDDDAPGEVTADRVAGVVVEAIDAVRASRPDLAVGLLVDDDGAGAVADDARARGIPLALRVDAADAELLELANGDDFGAHVDAAAPDLARVRVRWNPSDDPDRKKTQARRLARLGAWLHETGRRFLVELDVPPHADDLADVDGDAARYDRDVRPERTRRAAREIRDLGIEPDVWVVAGMDAGSSASFGELVRDEGRDDVVVLLDVRDVPDEDVARWVAASAHVPAFRGLVLGASVWLPALRDHLGGGARDDAVAATAAELTRSLDTYAAAAAASAEE